MAAMIRAMTRHPAFAWRFDARAFAVALGLFVLLVLLATFGVHAGWVRGFFGDLLAVVWLHFVFKTFVEARPVPLASSAFAVGCALEFGQYLARVQHWQIVNPVLRVVVGSTPDWLDVLAYGLGAASVVGWELRAARPKASAP
jgi:glycopeptide antibiotics resistance protein